MRRGETRHPWMYVAFGIVLGALVVGVLLAPAARAECVDPVPIASVSSSGEPGNGASYSPHISADARYVAFASRATNLVAGDTNQVDDVFIRDRLTGTTERVSVSSGGREGNGPSGVGSAWVPPAYVYWKPLCVSADGRFVAFNSAASNLVPDDTNGADDIFVRDRLAATTERVSISSAAGEANGPSKAPAISADGRYVAFESDASNLVPGDTNAVTDIFVRDRLEATTDRVSVSTAGGQANGACRAPSVSADGMLVAFDSTASNLVPGDTNGWRDVFVHDRASGETIRASVASSGTQGNGSSHGPVLSGNGRWVAFESSSTNLAGGANFVFLRDLDTHVTRSLVVHQWSHDPSLSFDATAAAYLQEDCIREDGVECYFSVQVVNLLTGQKVFPPCYMTFSPSISADGRYVALATGGPTAQIHVFDVLMPVVTWFEVNYGDTCTTRRGVSLTYACQGSCVQVRFRNEGEDWSAWEPCGAGRTWTLSAGAGVKKVYAQCGDGSGWLSAEKSDTIGLATFIDVWCGDVLGPYVEALVRAAITAGCSGNPPMYCPYSNITRAQMAVFLCRAAGKEPLDRPTPTFCDVPKTHPYYGWIERLADAASWGGNPPTIGCLWFPCKKFCPSTAVLRDEMAAFLVRATGKTPMPSCSGILADVWSGSWACPYIERLTDAASWAGGVTVTSGCACPSGYPPGAKCYCPKSVVTRGQMAVFLVRAFGIPM